jgi:lycopene cyclase domain-containing protein
MTYLGFLFYFLVVPLIIFLVITLWHERQRKTVPGFQNGRPVWMAIVLQILLAVVYTTPWDNYLVATGVWYYNPKLISGLVLGWVPIEEYTFFVLETMLTGVWWWFLAGRLIPAGEFRPRRSMRIVLPAILGMLWLGGLYLIISGWKPGTYLSLTLAWALPAIAGQLAFGADILWHFRKLVATAILPIFLYLSAADSLAISSGTWTIDATQSTGIFIGMLPIEEAVFFLVTVTLIAFGLTLTLARAGQARWMTWVMKIFGRAVTWRYSREQISVAIPPSERGQV